MYVYVCVLESKKIIPLDLFDSIRFDCSSNDAQRDGVCIYRMIIGWEGTINIRMYLIIIIIIIIIISKQL